MSIDIIRKCDKTGSTDRTLAGGRRLSTSMVERGGHDE